MTEAMVEEGVIDPSTRRKGKPKEAATEDQHDVSRVRDHRPGEGGTHTERGLRTSRANQVWCKGKGQGWNPLERDTYPLYQALDHGP